MRLDASILGRIGYDLYSEQPGVALKNVRHFSRYLGGSSANIAVGLARLGMRVGLLGCVGRDALGDFLVDFLEAEGVETRHVHKIEGYQSSLCLTEISPPDRFPQVFYRKEAADTRVALGKEELEYLCGARMFVTNGTSLCASPARESTYRALERARAAGVKVVLDVDYRAMSWRSAADAGLAVWLALPWVDILIGNDEELRLVADRDDLAAAVHLLRARGLPVLVSKLGHRGTELYAGKEKLFLPPCPVKVVSTIGAGDGFAAGFLYGVLKGMPWRDCLRYGNAAAAIVVSRLSCSEAMPRLHEIDELLKGKSKKVQLKSKKHQQST